MTPHETSILKCLEMTFRANEGFKPAHRDHFLSSYTLPPERIDEIMAKVKAKYETAVVPADRPLKIAEEIGSGGGK